MSCSCFGTSFVVKKRGFSHLHHIDRNSKKGNRSCCEKSFCRIKAKGYSRIYLQEVNLCAGPRNKNIKLEWEKIYGICVGIARGLTFLHKELVPHIVHRDIKASNILLDKDFTPKIGDFGLAELFPDNITYISTRIAGTAYGSFYEKGELLELVDPQLEDFPQEDIVRYMKVALFCTQATAAGRLMMSQVLDMLTKDIKLNEKLLTAPGFFNDCGCFSKKNSSLDTTNYQMSSARH